jgi:hypothetical protein
MSKSKGSNNPKIEKPKVIQRILKEKKGPLSKKTVWHAEY